MRWTDYGIAACSARVAVLVVATDEEIEIARQPLAALAGRDNV